MQAIARRAAAPVFALSAVLQRRAHLRAATSVRTHGDAAAWWLTRLCGTPRWRSSRPALLIGYLYAHLLARLKDLRIQAAIHAIVLVAAFLVLPIHVSTALGAPNSRASRALACRRARALGRRADSRRPRPPRRCCNLGTPAPAAATRTTHIISMQPAISAASLLAGVSGRHRTAARRLRTGPSLDRRLHPRRRADRARRRHGDCRERGTIG